MPRLKYRKKGKRVNLWIPHEQLKTAALIDNLSGFFQLCLDNAGDIMAWDLLQKRSPQVYRPFAKIDDVIDTFNEKHPPNSLTQKRNKNWQENSQPKQELW